MSESDFAPYIDPLYPVGTAVLIEEPTHDFYYVTRDVLGIVYEAYMHKGFKMYAVLLKKAPDLYDMKFMKPSTEHLTVEVCCQHLDEERLTPIQAQTPERDSDGVPQMVVEWVRFWRVQA